MSMMTNNYLVFTYKTKAFSLVRKDKTLTDKLNSEGETTREVHKADTDLTAGDTAMKAPAKARQNIVNYINDNTIAFGNNGKLVSTNKAFFGNFKQGLDDLIKKFYESIPSEDEYINAQAYAKKNSKFFDPTMYPSYDHVVASYHVEYDFIPISTKIDTEFFDLEKEYIDYIKDQAEKSLDKKLKDCESQIRERLAVAMKDVIKTVEDVIKTDADGQKHIKAKGFKRTKVEGIVRLPNILRSLNITNDKGIADTIDKFDKAIAPFRTGLENDKAFCKNIKDNPQTRATIRNDVKKVLDKFQF